MRHYLFSLRFFAEWLLFDDVCGILLLGVTTEPISDVASGLLIVLMSCEAPFLYPSLPMKTLTTKSVFFTLPRSSKASMYTPTSTGGVLYDSIIRTYRYGCRGFAGKCRSSAAFLFLLLTFCEELCILFLDTDLVALARDPLGTPLCAS